MENFTAEILYKRLAAWFHEKQRTLPWRSKRTPYRVWISEIMLQQTQVATVIPYFEHWMTLWPTLMDLAEAEEDTVLKAWEGLGYYSRARNILRTAKQLRAEGKDELPCSYAELLKLPGIGPYTAGAVASLACGLPEAAVDGNVLRVISRLLARPWQAGRAKDQKACREYLMSLMREAGISEDFSPAVFNEALIELGALLCRAKTADCPHCPLRTFCAAHLEGEVFSYPLAAEKTKKSSEEYTALILHDEDGNIAVRKRPPEGLLAGLWEFILADGRRSPAEIEILLDDAGLALRSLEELASKKHVFSHLIWEMRVYEAEVQRKGAFNSDEEIFWRSPDEVLSLPFSSALSDYRDLCCRS